MKRAASGGTQFPIGGQQKNKRHDKGKEEEKAEKLILFKTFVCAREGETFFDM